MSSRGLPAAAVRMITPPVKPCVSRNSRTMPRSRALSSRDSIFRDTPTWSTVGMNTRKRPGMVTCEVRRARLDPDLLPLAQQLFNLRLGPFAIARPAFVSGFHGAVAGRLRLGLVFVVGG